MFLFVFCSFYADQVRVNSVTDHEEHICMSNKWVFCFRSTRQIREQKISILTIVLILFTFLFITQGTSRLVSTDSEGINNSPPYQSPIQHQHQQYQQQQQSPTVNYSSAAASLVAVLSDEQTPQVPNYNDNAETAVEVETPTKSKPKSLKKRAEPIKLKIKTNAKLKHSPETVEEQVAVNQTSTRPSRKQRAPAASTSLAEANANIPEIGTASYELYKTLTAEDTPNVPLNAFTEPSETSQNNSSEIPAQATANSAEQITEQPTVNPIVAPKKRAARTKAKPEKYSEPAPTLALEEPVPKKIRSRRNQVVETAPIPTPEADVFARRHITAAAKKQYTEPDVIPTESIPVQTLPEAQSPELSEPAELVEQPKTRGRRGKKAVEVSVEVAIPQPPTRSGRATRNNTNGNMMQVRR